MVEQGTHNPLVLGSSPGGPTTKRTNPRSVASHASGVSFFNDETVPRTSQIESQDPRKADYPSGIVLMHDPAKKEEPPP